MNLKHSCWNGFSILCTEPEVDTPPHLCKRLILLINHFCFQILKQSDVFPSISHPIKACFPLGRSKTSMESNEHGFRLYGITTESILTLADMRGKFCPRFVCILLSNKENLDYKVLLRCILLVLWHLSQCCPFFFFFLQMNSWTPEYYFQWTGGAKNHICFLTDRLSS